MHDPTSRPPSSRNLWQNLYQISLQKSGGLCRGLGQFGDQFQTKYWFPFPVLPLLLKSHNKSLGNSEKLSIGGPLASKEV